MCIRDRGETGQVGEGGSNNEELEGGVVGSRQSSAVERGTGVGRKTSLPTEGRRTGNGST